MASFKFSIAVFGLSLSVLLISCSPLTPSGWTQESSRTKNGVSQSVVQKPENAGQMLPITAKVTIKGTVIELEVARTPQEQAIGLMFRTSLADNRGMLFPFAEARQVGFWMRNCKIPLDMIFLRDGVVQAIQVNAPPCQSDPCPVYEPDVPVDQVIELRGGRSQELGLAVGDRLSIEPVTPPKPKET